MLKQRKRAGWSLVELLVVIGIIGVLTALGLSAVMRVRSAALRLDCSNNLRQIGLALVQYHDRDNVFPPGCKSEAPGEPYPYMSWNTRLLPFLEQGPVWEEALAAYAQDPFFRTHAVAGQVMRVFTCPADARVAYPKSNGFPACTSFLGVEGTNLQSKDGLLFVNSRVRLAEITDGASMTLLVGERPPSADLSLGWWYAGWGQGKDGSADLVLGAAELNINSLWVPESTDCPPGPYAFGPGRLDDQCDLFHFWSLHSGGAHFLFADGSVRFLPYSAADILPALATRAGRENVDIPE